MLRRLLVGVFAGVVAAEGLGCSTAPGAKPTVRVPWASSAAVSRLGPARWVFTPPEPRGLLGRMASPEGPELYFGRNGERWRVDPQAQRTEAAGDLAEQDLVAAARSQSGGWLFVGAGGSIFEADEPLGPFQRALAAPEPVARVEASPQGLLAITLRGTLLRSGDGGATFLRAALDVPFAADVRLLEDGSGLLLAFPERLYETRDGGLQWTPVSTPTIGAQRFHRFSEDSLLVQGISGSLLWKKDGSLRPTRAQPPTSAFQLPDALGPAPDAASFTQGMGFWRGDQAVEVRPPEKRGAPWQVGVGRPGERLQLTPLQGTEGCQRLALDGEERSLIVACSTAVRGASLAAVRLLRYGAPEEAPEVLAGTLEGSLGEARLALGRSGQILAWGVCRTGGGRASCDGETPLLLPRWQASPEAPEADAPSPWQAVAIAGQNGRPVAAAFGAGGRAYLVAQRGKTRDLGLFVSQDEGRSFEGRELGLAGALEESERKRLAGLRSASLSVADDGIVAVAFEGQLGALVAVTDEDGRVLSVSSAPGSSARTRIGLAGRRLLAVDGPLAFESLDGGVSWTHLGEVPSLRCPDRGACERRVSCYRGGCLVGSQVGRLGWGGQADSGRRSGERTTVAVGLPRIPPPPVVCRLGREKWMPLPRGSEMPSAHRADRGKSAWATSAFTPSSGQVLSVHAPAAGASKPEEIPLMPATRDVGRAAMAVSQEQIEGVAAVRLELVPKKDGAPPGIQRVEVAWENHFEGKISRGTIPAPKDAPSLALEPALGQVSLVSLPLLSISNGGVFVRLGNEGGSEVFFLDHRGKLERRQAPVIPQVDVQGDDLNLRHEAIRVDGVTTFIGYRDALVARLLDRGKFEAVSLFPPADSGFLPENSLSFTYLNGASFLVHVGRVPQAGVSQVSLLPMRGAGPLLGPRVAGPSQRLLVERYRACAAQDRSTTPRIVAPGEIGTRRGVLIEGPDGSAFASMVSETMILYGTAESPCGSVLEGVPARQEQRNEGQERALVYLGDLEHGWFFRSGVNDAVEARPMSCKLAPGTPLPPEVQTALDRRPPTPGLTITGKKPIRIRR
jgi:hypothetical protein